jgi:CRP/FNR family transcriptional regulator
MTETEDVVQLLEAVPFFHDVDEARLRLLAARLRLRSFETDQVVCREGDPCDGFWVIEQGSVNIQKAGRDGRIRILETCRSGGFFALVAALDGGLHPANVVARESSRLLLFPTRELQGLAAAFPGVGLAIARVFAVRLRRLTCDLAAACLQSVRARVAELLVHEASERGRRHSDGRVELALLERQEELARRIGTEREVLARALRSLREEGLIEQSRGDVLIPDIERLRLAASA